MPKKAMPVESSDSSSESEVEVPVKKTKGASGKAVSTKKVPAKTVKSSSSDSSSEDEAPVKPAAKKAAAMKPAAKKPVAESSSSSESSSEDEAPAKPAAKKAAAKKPVAESSSSSESSSEDEAPVKPVVSKKRAAESGSSGSESTESEEETKPAAKKPKVETAEGASEGSHKIYVKGLPWKALDYEVKDFFKGCGNIVSVNLPVDESGRSSGTAFVVFADRKSMDAALELDGQTWPDTERWLKIQEAHAATPRTFGAPPGSKPEGCNTVFCGNLPWEVEEETLRQLFAGCGEISRVRFATNPENGEFKGFGHVEFVDGDSTDAAVALSGTDVLGRAIRVDYAPPRNRDSFGGAGRGGGRGGGRSPAGRGRGGDFGGRGRGGGRSPFGGGRGGGFNANKGTISLGATSGGKKTTFD